MAAHISLLSSSSRIFHCLVVVISKSVTFSFPSLTDPSPSKKVFSIKHDLARSCFQFWLKIGDEGGKILKKKTGEALAETVFSQNFVTLGADFEGHN